MRAFKGSHPRLKDRFMFEVRRKRRLMLLSTILFYTFRTSLIGVNQDLTTYIPEMSMKANELFQS